MKIVLLLIILRVTFIAAGTDDGWKWMCEDDELCVRISGPKTNSTYDSIEACRLVCGSGAVWPLPTAKFLKSKELIRIEASKIQFNLLAPSAAQEVLLKNVDVFKNNVAAECGPMCNVPAENRVDVTIKVNTDDLSLTWKTDEGYTLKSEGSSWLLTAETVFGARHGLETLSQLIASYSTGTGKGLVMLKSADIIDKPIYPHRSLLIDTGRNYLDVETIKRQIDAMAASKMNVLHWHATDSQSFPYFSESVPLLTTYGAYSQKKIYTKTDVKELLAYARIRGVRIVMEIDAPSHAGNGWQWGPNANLGNLAVCINQEPWRSYCIQPPCGQLNPANQNVYRVLESLYGDIIKQFPKNEIFHMGGDEVFFPCWNSTKEIIDYLKGQGKGQNKEDFLDLWGEFQEKALSKFDGLVGNTNTPILLWSSELTDPEVIEKYLDKNRYIIETWVPSTDPLPQKLLEKGYKLIISTKNAWYLDHGFWGTTKYYTWRTAYSNKIQNHKNVLGGEVCMWGELVDGNSIDSRIWPRAAAAAERLWSNPAITTKTAERRMYRHRERLITRGIQAETLAPFWCYQNEGQCL